MGLSAVDMENDRLARACGQGPILVDFRSQPVTPSGSRVAESHRSRLSDKSTGISAADRLALPIPQDSDDPLLDIPFALSWGLRPRATSVRVPQRQSTTRNPARPRSASQPASIPLFQLGSPRGGLRSLREALEEEGVLLEDCLDVQEVFERWESQGERSSARGEAVHHKTFGSSVSTAVKCASMSTVLGGYQHNVPWVVYACVEELNRTGIYQPGLFRAVPNRIRLARLKEAFDLCPPICALSSDLDEMCPRMTPTLSTTRASLRKESMPDICALLKKYLDLLPEPLLDANLAAALHMLCVQPSLAREEAEADSTDSGSDGGYFASHARARSAPSPSPSSTSTADLPMTPSEHRDALLLLEAPQVLLAQHLLRLAPPPALALLAYLLGFFTQLPLCPDNGMGFADVARMFGRVLIGGADVGVVRGCVHWLLERWARISDGLFDVAAGQDDGPVHTESAPVTACRSTFDASARSPPLGSSENTPRVRQGEGNAEEGEVGLARMQMPYDPGLLERGHRPHLTSVSSNSSTTTIASLESEDMLDLDTPYTFGSAKDAAYVEEAQPGVTEYDAPFDAFERATRVMANYTLDREYVSCPPSPRHYARARDGESNVNALYSPSPSVRSLDIESSWECYSGSTTRSRCSPAPPGTTSLRWARSSSEGYPDSDCESCGEPYRGGPNENTPRNSASFDE
ncbi:hypothetical protein TRAPUB_8954 [Trametes pubescens]|uniref:Rho-GAP domain-containing protein n=1 Tax=Trametes pubescens TaxID=154538 RepID=A0A1M2W3T2_TRAPU|nr:hypothetical protein TRAPUB_8954 [Trametes pubescens]